MDRRRARPLSAMLSVVAGSMAASLIVQPQADNVAHGRVAATTILGSDLLWAAVFALLCVVAGFTAAFVVEPRRIVPVVHGIGVTVYLTYGVGSLGTAIINETGWTAASLCIGTAIGHYAVFRSHYSGVNR